MQPEHVLNGLDPDAAIAAVGDDNEILVYAV
jgi:hypothetical protein